MARKDIEWFQRDPVLGPYKELFNYVPHPKQLEFHKLDNKIKIFVSGNRGGKSYAASYEIVWAALGIHPFCPYPDPPLRIRVVGVDWNTILHTVHLPMLMKILPPESRVWHAEPRILELFNGSTIEFRSMDQDLEKFMGASLDIVWMDEEPPEKIFNENLMRVADRKGRILLTFTPLHGLTWSYELINSDKTDPDTGKPLVGVVTSRTMDNPYISKNEIEIIKQLCRDPDELAARLEGQYFTRSGLIYKEFDPFYHVIEPFPIPEDWPIMLGIDHHTRNPQAVVFCAIDPEDKIYVWDEFYQEALIPEVCAAIKEKLGGRKITLAIIDVNAATPDAVTGQSAKTEYHRHGIYVVPTRKGKNSLLEGIAIVREYLREGKLFFFKNCRETIRQIKMYRWAEWSYRMRDKKDPREMPLKKEDHAADALRYVVQMRPRYRPPALSSTVVHREPLFKKTGY